MEIVGLVTLILIALFSGVAALVCIVLPMFSADEENRAAARRTLIVSVLIGTLYGGAIHLCARVSYFQSVLDEVSLGYVFVLPFVLGVVTLWCAADEQRRSWKYRIVAPLGTSSVTFVCSLLTGWEGAICLIIGAMVFIPLASLGGVLAGMFLTRSKKTLHVSVVPILMITPLLTAYTESFYTLSSTTTNAHTSIRIHASPADVWKQIIRVAPIHEPLDGWFYRIGFPKPISADLDVEGVGGVRHARFERDLEFIETVTEWEPQRAIGFRIAVDPEATPLTTLDEHVTVGGRYFDVLQGRYEIEELSEHDVVLHLESNFRVSTNFNFYANWWAHFLMEDIQQTILNVIKQRCERNR